MRVLVAAPYPPAPDEAATVALRHVEALVAGGDEVEVISPLPSAAALHGPLAGLAGAWQLARRSRRHDSLHLVVSRHILFRPELPKLRRVLEGAAMGLALRAWRSTSADLGDLSDVPGGGGGLSGRFVWPAIGTIYVSDDLVANHAVKVLGFPASRVVVRTSPGRSRVPGRPAQPAPGRGPKVAPPPPRVPWAVAPGAAWEDVMGEIVARAAAERARVTGDDPSDV